MKPWRWLKREWQSFLSSHLLIIFTLTLGMSGIYLISKLKASFLLSLRSQERELLSSDFALSARRPLSPEEVASLEKTAGPFVIARYRLTDLSSMLYTDGQARLAEVRVVEPGFPFYGNLKDEGGALRFTAGHPLFEKNCMWISAEMRRLTGSQLGGRLKLGESWLEDCGTVLEDSTQGARGFSLAARVYLGAPQLAATKLLGEGSIATHAYHLKLDAAGQALAESWKKPLIASFSEPGVRARTPRDASEQMARSGEILGDYLQLASLVGLLLAVVGCFYLFRSLLHRRLKDIAVLRALGHPPVALRVLLFLPLVADFLLALPLSWIAASSLHPVITSILGNLFGAQFPPVPFPWDWAWQSPMILLVVVCGLVPAVEEAMNVPVRALLQDQDHVGVLPWRRAWLFIVIGFVAFTLLAVAVAKSWKVGGLFMSGLLVATLLLFALAAALRALLSVLATTSHPSKPFGLSVGLMVRRLLRRPVPTLLTLVALGLGGTLVSLLGHLELALSREFTLGQSNRPELFLFDIQDEQTQPLKDFLSQQKAQLLSVSPMVRGKITTVNGVAFQPNLTEEDGLRTREQEDQERFRQRMLNMSWAGGLNSSESLEEGATFADARVPEGEHAVSLETRFASRMGLDLGDKIQFEVLGVPLVGRVVNLRTVKWTSFLPNFFVSFAPGALEEAPKSWLMAVSAGGKSEAAKLQNALTLKFPNISAVDVGQVVEKMMVLFTHLQQSLLLMAWFAFLVGVVVVMAIAQDQMLRRQHEIMLEKTLGLSPWSVVSMVMGEFMILALLAITGGGLAGALIASVLVTQAFQAEPVWSFTLIFLQSLGGTLLTLFPLLLGARRIFTWRPAGLLQGP